MSKLNNPNFIGFGGKLQTGVVPPVMRVHGGQLSEKQFAEVTHVFKMFMGAANVSSAPVSSQRRVLADGSRVEMRTERFGISQTVVDVWPVENEENTLRLAHGVSAQVTWASKVSHYFFDDKEWKFGPGTPQVGQGTTTGNHALIELPPVAGQPKTFMFLPMVHAAGNGGNYSLWTFARKIGLRRGKDNVGNDLPAVERAFPVLVKDTKGEKIIFGFVYSDGKKIYKQDGSVDIETPEVPPRNPGEESTVVRYPPCTNSLGTILYHTQGRTFCVSQTFERYNFLFGHQAYVPTKTAYIASGTMKSKNFTAPLGWAPVITTDGNTGAKGEVNKSAVKEKSYILGPNSVGSTRQVYPPIYPSIGWTVSDARFVDSTDTVTDKVGGWEITEHAKGTNVEITELFPLPNNLPGASYMKFVNALNYPRKYTLIAGRTTVSADRTPFGYAQNGKLRSGAGVSSIARTERVYKLEIDGRPYIGLDCGDLGVLKIFEGTTTSRFNGKINDVVTTKFNPFASPDYCPSLGGNTYYVTGTNPPDDPPNSNMGYAWYSWVMSNHLDFESLLSTYPNASLKEEENEALLHSGSYEFTSRRIVDFDSRIGLVVMLKVYVKCQGAAWVEKPNSYRGHMVASGTPQYTVKISMAWCHGTLDTTKEKEEILVETTFARPTIEFTPHLPGNVFIWPTPESEYTPLMLSLPPEISPPYQAYHQLYRIPYGQAYNDNLAGSDLMPNPGGPAKEQLDEKDLQYSKIVNGKETPHAKMPVATAYGRSFTIAEFDDALWMLRKLKINAGQIGKLPDDTVEYFYAPAIKEALPLKRRLELVNGEKKQWSDDFPPDEGKTKPVFAERETVLYYV